MSRGKRARATARRRAAEAAARLEELRRDIACEQNRLARARGRAERTALAQRRLSVESKRTRRRLEAAEAEAAVVAARLVQPWRQVLRARQALEKAQDGLRAGAGADVATEAARSGLKVKVSAVHRSASLDYRDWWLEKTTRRRVPHPEIDLGGWVPDDLPSGDAALRPYALSRLGQPVTREGAFVWAVPPWLKVPDGADAPDLRRDLGAVGSGAPVLRPGPYDGARLRPDATITLPWRHAPLVGQPRDAVDLAYWYHHTAWAQAWPPTTQAAVPFWLPAEHSAAFPAGQPIPPGTDLRLPFPLIFAAFGEPWTIDPRRDDGDYPYPLMLYGRGAAAGRSRSGTLADTVNRLTVAGHDRDDLPTPLELLECRGGVVEGLLLAADPAGAPVDEFAWCLLVNHPLGFPLARVVIPASRAQTSWRNAVDNITAGIALSVWQVDAQADPPAPRSPRSTRDNEPASMGSTPPLHILDIEATSPHRGESDGTGRSVRTHLRRGHWRHQRTGPGRTELRWIWVRPTVVAGEESSTMTQIYRLTARKQ